jgi:two-component system, NarL family, sensor kinase
MSDSTIIYVICTTILVFLLGVFIISTIYFFQKKQQLFHKNLEDIELKHKQNILESQIEIQEQTFDRISKEIHDDVNSRLTFCKLTLSTLDFYNPESQKERLDKSIDKIGEAILQLSNISKSLSSDLIKQNGLLHSIEQELDIIRSSKKYTINYEAEGDIVYMGEESELVIFRILQESLNNIIKHSKATAITLHLNYHKEKLKIYIQDDGTGFDLSVRYSPEKSKSTGLKNIEHRVKVLEGTFEIVSQKWKGTTIKIAVPILIHKK